MERVPYIFGCLGHHMMVKDGRIAAFHVDVVSDVFKSCVCL